MICFIALFVFALLAIFSAKYRPFALEAFDCVFKRVTLRPCTTGFDKKMKMRISTKIMSKHEGAGTFVNKHFEAISWLLTLSMIVSFFFAAQGLYYWIAFGNCNGLQGGPCVLNDITGKTDSNSCALPANTYHACTGQEKAFCSNDANCLKWLCKLG